MLNLKNNVLMTLLFILIGALIIFFILKNNHSKSIPSALQESSDQLVNKTLTKSEPKNYLTTETDCQNFTNTQKDNCIQYIEFNKILKTNYTRSNKSDNYNPKDCEKLASIKLRDYCYYNLAREAKSWKECLNIKNDVKLKEFCINDNAWINNNTKTCDFFKTVDEEDYAECVDRVKAINQGEPNGKKGDIKKCEAITVREYFGQCIMRSNGKCEDLKNQKTVDKCNDIINLYEVLSSHDKSKCAIFKSENYKKVCQIFFANGETQDIDSDKDGMIDVMELTYLTDPFTFDTEYAEEWRLDDYNKLLTDFSKKDSDNDGVLDWDEKKYHTDIYNSDSNSNGISDHTELESKGIFLDFDGDTLSDKDENEKYHTDAFKFDTDGDGLSDSIEVDTYHTSPTEADTDGDGFNDLQEVLSDNNPLK